MSLPEPYYQRDGITIFHGDCRSILPDLEPVDLVLTDPPYGIGYEASRYQNATHSGVMLGDKEGFNPSALMGLGRETIIWGGNNFANLLPRGGWICWDKRVVEAADGVLGSPFELAWCSIETTYKMFRIQHGGFINADGAGIKRVHPTQKPLRLMGKCIKLFPDARTILDPYMGSGTTLVAAKQLRRHCVGIEIEERYCEIAARRCEQRVFDFDEKKNAKQDESIQGSLLEAL